MKTRIIATLLMLSLSVQAVLAQDMETEKARTLPEFKITANELKAKLYFLASDFMRGRYTGSEENRIAANYIAEHLRAYGWDYAPGQDSYFQEVPFEQVTPPTEGQLNIAGTDYEMMQDFIFLGGDATQIEEAEAVFVNYGWVDEESDQDDYANIDVEGKVVFTLPGTPEGQSPQLVFQAIDKKRKLATERGAVAVVELFRLQFPWNFFTNYFGKPSMRLAPEEETPQSIPYVYLKEKSDVSDVREIQEGSANMVQLSSGGFERKRVYSPNVVGVLEGTDPELKDEYVLLSAHFDHVGVGAQGGGATTAQDSIFNGARDNGMGTTALLAAGKALGEQRTKRSVIILACTGEEIGLLGSRYYAENPLIPLKQTIFNLNTDGAGYSDTSGVAILGFGRTGTDEEITAATQAFDLDIFPDPAPEQGLFDRSDNVSFAARGVPALTYSPGFTAFDQEIMKNYHQITDEPQTVNYQYLLEYCASFSHLARLIADDEERPKWKAGDKYEEAGNKLYNE